MQPNLMRQIKEDHRSALAPARRGALFRDMIKLGSELEMLHRYSVLEGYSVVGPEGGLGGLRDLLVSDESWEVRYLAVETGTWFFRRTAIVDPECIVGLDRGGGVVKVALTQGQIEASDELIDNPPVSLQKRKLRDRAAGWLPMWPVAKVSGPPGQPSSGVPRAPLGDPDLRSLDELRGYKVSTTDGQEINIEDFLIDEEGWILRYVAGKPESWPSRRRVLIAVPWITSVSWENRRIEVDVDSTSLDQSPDFDGLDTLDRDAEKLLHVHHGRRAYWE